MGQSASEVCLQITGPGAVDDAAKHTVGAGIIGKKKEPEHNLRLRCSPQH